MVSLSCTCGHKRMAFSKQTTVEVDKTFRHKSFEVLVINILHVQPHDGKSYFQSSFTEKDGRVKSEQKDFSVPCPCHMTPTRIHHPLPRD